MQYKSLCVSKWLGLLVERDVKHHGCIFYASCNKTDARETISTLSVYSVFFKQQYFNKRKTEPNILNYCQYFLQI